MVETQCEYALSFKGLVKKFKDFTLGPIDLDLEPGCILGLIGPNGSGKTTTLNLVAGLLKHHSGSIKVFGRETNPNDVKWKYNIGFVDDDPVFYESWSVRRNLNFMSEFYPDWSNEFALQLTDRFELDPNKKARQLSKGNRAKLALIMALAHYPRLLLFDEPSSGLDPLVRTEFLDVLYELNKKGDTAIIYSTHILSDISRLADELIFLKNGKFMIRERIDVLTDKWKRVTFETNAVLPSIKAVVNLGNKDKTYIATSINCNETLSHLNEIGANNIQVVNISIDDIVIEIFKLKEDKLTAILQSTSQQQV